MFNLKQIFYTLQKSTRGIISILIGGGDATKLEVVGDARRLRSWRERNRPQEVSYTVNRAIFRETSSLKYWNTNLIHDVKKS